MRRNNIVIAGLVVIGVLVVVIAALVVRADSVRAPEGGPATATPARRDAGAIARENAKPAATDWHIDRPALNGEIEAYAGEVSLQAGETLDLYVSTKIAGAKYEADVYRMGWYGGAGARNVRSIKNIDGENQGRWDPLRGLQDCKSCKVDADTLLVEANWKRSLQIKVDKDWISGYYLVKLHDLKSDTSTYAIFIVRDDASDAPILVQASTNTWQAYNTWGDASLYGSFGADRKYVAKTRRAYRVSYDRPYDPSMRDEKNYGAGEFFAWEYNFVRWAESQGYDMSYTTNVDVSLGTAPMNKHKLFVSLGHDEYWTKQQRDAVEGARDAGVNVAFLSGNEAYWQGRLEASSTGVNARVLTVYKDAALDPLARTNSKETTVLFADPPVSRPQSMLSGVAYGSNTQPDYIAWRPAALDSWIFTGSGITGQDSFPGIVGYEYDHQAATDQRPAGVQIVGSSPVSGFLGSDTSVSALYVAPSGATVFAAGTVAWAWGLDDFGHEGRGAFADDELRQVTKNILNRLGAPPAPPAAGG
ncbi:MAG: hypothetical protein M3P30_10500 [Chloroflexota bacterium]|nr:hypothetical protein [Chloroflexota bacterium]